MSDHDLSTDNVRFYERMRLPQISPQQLAGLLSPSLLFFVDTIQSNIDQMIRMVKDPNRLRPHCKTHKSTDITRMLLNSGIMHHKAATVAEAEMLAKTGVPDVVIAYAPIGPNIERVLALVLTYPETKFTVTADHPLPLQQLSETFAQHDQKIAVLLDLNVGQDRTGIAVESPDALNLYRLFHELKGIAPAGFQVYDGHVHEPNLQLRSQQVTDTFRQVLKLKTECESEGLAVPELLCGGTPSFPVYAEMTDPAIKCSPGTCVLHDAGYGKAFPDLNFRPAAALACRVISRPAADLMTLDLGNKAVAADPLVNARAWFPDLPNAEVISHNEEHLVIRCPESSRFQPGDVLLAIPGHICPTSALHSAATVISKGDVIGQWEITARNRSIGI